VLRKYSRQGSLGAWCDFRGQAMAWWARGCAHQDRCPSSRRRCPVLHSSIPADAVGPSRESVSSPTTGTVQRARSRAAAYRCGDSDQLGHPGEMLRMARCAVRRSAEYADPVAPCGLEVVLEMEMSTRPPSDSSRTAGLDPENGPGKPSVGRRADCQRIVGETGYPGIAADGAQVHAEASERSATRWPALVDVLEESCASHFGVWLLRGGHCDMQAALRVRRNRAR